MLSLIIATLIGGCPPTRVTYGYRQQSYGYAQPTYQQPTAYFQADPAHYAAVVAAYVRKEAAAAEQLKSQQDLAARLDKLTAAMDRLTAATAEPAPQPQPFQQPYASPQQPVYQAPPAPPKSAPPAPSPQYPIGPPPVPGKTSFGDVAPPPYANPPTNDGFLPSFGSGIASGASPLAAILQRNKCAQCHSGPGSAGGVALFDSTGNLSPLDLSTLQSVAVQVTSNKMPPRGGPVPDPDKAALVAAVRQQIMGAMASLGGQP